MFQSTGVVKTLFYINVLAFIFTLISQNLMQFPVTDYLALFPLGSMYFHFYQFITHMFMHGGIMHILFNMVALLSIGPACEEYFGEKKFLLFYFIIGFFGALTQLFFVEGALIGASGAIYGLAVIFAILHPNTPMFPFGIKIKYLMSAMIAIEVALALYMNDGVGHFCHLGGALAGLLLLKLDQKFNFKI